MIWLIIFLPLLVVIALVLYLNRKNKIESPDMFDGKSDNVESAKTEALKGPFGGPGGGL
ncbi:hypothetical protein [Bacillus sp. CECT 9360]|uniref:hypothetical protein n=1 Tax=Bacillus sp. CECT 9360 TaxID=2845821 RepID=UPI001E41151C|nr:hypothetical protein [Bacillus sp. CECT 9360]CAH0346810.1 hypothetical protein BCI9360_03172 [Bacillus sp. CECT 9360]